MIKREVMDPNEGQEVRVVSASVVAQLQAQGLQVRFFKFLKFFFSFV